VTRDARPPFVLLGVSAAAPAVAFVSAFLGFALASGASTSQNAAFVVSGIAILVGIVAGLLAETVPAPAVRKRGRRWALVNLLVVFSASRYC
jgi:hypothetical protein